MRLHGRIALCGMVSQYPLDDPEGIKNLMCIIYQRLRVEGFVVFDCFHLFPKFWDFMLPYIREGKIACVEDIAEGLDSCPASGGARKFIMKGQITNKYLILYII